MKYEHLLSLNFIVKTDAETIPTEEELLNSIKEYLEKNKGDLRSNLEWVSTEEVSS